MNYNKVIPARFIERENRFVARVSLTGSTDEIMSTHDRCSRFGSDNDNVDQAREEVANTKEAIDQANETFDLDRGTEVRVHVKNTGRCKELLVPGATVYLEDHAESMGKRKYRYDLIAVEKVTQEKTILINMDSQAPNIVVEEALKSGNLRLVNDSNNAFESHRLKQDVYNIIRPETTFGSSRFDFYIEMPSETTGDAYCETPSETAGDAYCETPSETAGENYRKSPSSSDKDSHMESSLSYVDIVPRRAFIEVKGVTLEKGDIARFPDAPTERGVKHIRELEQALAAGYETYIIFVIQMKGIEYFEPNDSTHPEFGEALRHAEKTGVKILAYDCKVDPDRLMLDQPIQIKL